MIDSILLFEKVWVVWLAKEGSYLVMYEEKKTVAILYSMTEQNLLKLIATSFVSKSSLRSFAYHMFLSENQLVDSVTKALLKSRHDYLATKLLFFPSPHQFEGERRKKGDLKGLQNIVGPTQIWLKICLLIFCQLPYFKLLFPFSFFFNFLFPFLNSNITKTCQLVVATRSPMLRRALLFYTLILASVVSLNLKPAHPFSSKPFHHSYHDIKNGTFKWHIIGDDECMAYQINFKKV